MTQSMQARNWRDLIRPKSLVEEDRDAHTEFYGKFVCEPLERGFGITICNSLRRVLLSSLQGAAATAVRIDGALHEFTTIPDVVEDVTDIVLNLKEVLLKTSDSKPRVLRIEKDGEGRVNASLRPAREARRTRSAGSKRPPAAAWAAAPRSLSAISRAREKALAAVTARSRPASWPASRSPMSPPMASRFPTILE